MKARLNLPALENKMKTTLKFIVCIVIFISPFFLIRGYINYERKHEFKAVQQLLTSEQKWSNTRVDYAFRSQLMIMGTVDSESSLSELRLKLKEIGARRTVIAVKVTPK